MSRPAPTARCPLRPADPCTLCQLDVTGPQDCPLVYLALGDEELQRDWAERRRTAAEPSRHRG